MRINTADFLR